MAEIILGLAGEMAAGKDTAANYLKEKHGAAIVSYSGMLFDIVDRLFLERSRKNLVTVSEALRSHFGQDIMAKVIAEEVKRTATKIVCIPNVRRDEDIIYLSRLPGFKLVEIFADQKIRYQRLTQRAEKSDDQTKTWEDFVKDHDLPTEVTIREVVKKADFRIDNNGTFERLYEQLETILSNVNGN